MLKTWLLSIIIGSAAVFLSRVFDLDLVYVILGMVCYHIAEHYIEG